MKKDINKEEKLDAKKIRRRNYPGIPKKLSGTIPKYL